MKILILISNALGDFLNSLPFLEHIKINFPNSKIYLATKPYYFEIFNYSTINVEYLIDIENLQLYRLFSPEINENEFKFFKEFQLIISFTGSKNENFRKNLSKLNKNSHFIFPISKDVEYSEALYLINSFPFRKKFKPKINLSFPSYSPEFIIIHPGSGNKKKNPSINFFIKLSKILNKKFSVKLIGGENEKDLEKVTKIEIFDSLKDVINELSSAILYIGCDSGISHLSASFNLPTFVLFGPTSYKTWKPVGENCVVLTKNLKCSPCDLECKKNYECLNFDPELISKIILNYLKNFSN